MRLCNRCGSPDLNTGFVCRACGLAPYDNAIFERPQPSASTASTTIHTLAHSKGVPTAAREAMLLMQERIAELEEALELIAREGGQAEYRIARAALSGKEQTDGE